MMTLNPKYWNAAAKAIDVEDEKASIFIEHNASIGAAREAILRDFIRRHTPEPFRIMGGFIRKEDANFCSRQCDILVYDPTISRPFYEIGDIAVLHQWAVKHVMEVKSDLDSYAFKDAVAHWKDVHWLVVPTFCFAFDGVEFSTFQDYISEAVEEEPYGIPNCIVNHRKNYVFVRSGYNLAPAPDGRRPAEHQFMVNFGASSPDNGQASAVLLDQFLRHLRPTQHPGSLSQWFEQLPVPECNKFTVDSAGNISTGNPLPE